MKFCYLNCVWKNAEMKDLLYPENFTFSLQICKSCAWRNFSGFYLR